MLICEKQEVNFGVAKEGTTVPIHFKLKNVSDEKIPIVLAKCDCGCSQPFYNKQVLEPSEEMIVTIIFDTIGKRGFNHKECNVQFYYKDNSFKSVLIFKGEVIK